VLAQDAQGLAGAEFHAGPLGVNPGENFFNQLVIVFHRVHQWCDR
jgi:hypothetical protein